METMDENLKGRSVSDEMILASLRMAAAIREPVPASVLQAARDAFAWRLIDAELAELVADSACELASAGTRGGGQPRLVTFEVPGGTSLQLIIKRGVPPSACPISLDTVSAAASANAAPIANNSLCSCPANAYKAEQIPAIPRLAKTWRSSLPTRASAIPSRRLRV